MKPKKKKNVFSKLRDVDLLTFVIKKTKWSDNIMRFYYTYIVCGTKYSKTVFKK